MLLNYWSDRRVKKDKSLAISSTGYTLKHSGDYFHSILTAWVVRWLDSSCQLLLRGGGDKYREENFTAHHV